MSEHDVDIDIALYEKNGYTPLTTSSALSGEEGIVYMLSAGDYELRLFYFGFHDSGLAKCDTYVLQVAIAPTPNVHCDGETKPNLTASMTNDLKSKGYYSYTAGDLYTHVHPSIYKDREEILVLPFTVNKTSIMQVVVFSDFLVGDVTAVLVTVTRNITAIHTLNRNILHTSISSGSYQLVIMTGKVLWF